MSSQELLSRRSPGGLASVLAAVVISVVAFCWFWLLDRLPSELTEKPVWDWALYLRMAQQFNSLVEQPWQGVAAPWNNRPLLPWLWSIVEGNGIDFLLAATIVGTVGMVLYAALLGSFLWNFLESKALWVSALLILLFAPSGVIRQTIAHPFSGIWLEGIAFLSLAFIWRFFSKNSAASSSKLLLLFPVIALSVAREFFLYGLIFYVLVGILARALNARGSRTNTFAKLELSGSSLVWLVVYSILGAVARFCLGVALPASSESALQPILSALVAFYRWANWIDVLTALFLALGPVLLLFMMTVSQSRLALDSHLLAPLVIGVVFALTGGTDIDRFIVWMAPVVVAQLFKGRTFAPAGIKRGWLLSFALLCLVLSMRPMLPAVSSYAIASSSECGAFPVVDYASDRARGFLYDTSRLAFADESTVGRYGVYPKDARVLQSQLETCGKDFFSGPGAGLDNIPVALSFINNQYSLLTVHPFHGDWKSRTPFVVQWLFALLIIWVLRDGALRSSMPRFWSRLRRT